MGFFDRLFGGEDGERHGAQPTGSVPPTPAPGALRRSPDEIAVERYRYLLRTAPPETLEQVHLEAFANLTPEQRAMVFQSLSASAPPGEAPLNDSPVSLATAATRSELRQPGTLERAFGNAGRGGGSGIGFGGVFASSMLGTISGMVIGSAIASAFIPDSVGADGPDSADSTGSGDAADVNADSDAAAGDAAAGGDGFGDFGGDSDFGGGDFGGDFGF